MFFFFFVFKQTFYSQLYAKFSWLKILVKLSINPVPQGRSKQMHACQPLHATLTQGRAFVLLVLTKLSPTPRDLPGWI